MLYRSLRLQFCALLLLVTTSGGCAMHAMDRRIEAAAHADMPRELNKVSLPPYRVEPPDILSIEAVNNIRPSSSALEAGDMVTIRLQNGLKIAPDANLDPQLDALEYQYQLEREIANKIVNGDFLVQADGAVDLGPEYGRASIAGLTLDQARDALISHFQQVGILAPKLTVTLPDVSGKQPVTGQHLVRLDGTISLGIYGEVYVAGMTLPQVKIAVENHLATQMHDPQVAVDVLSYNSKKIYVFMDGAGYGEQGVQLPCTGNETVLDVITQLEGLSQVSSKKIWVARPAPSEYEFSQILDVHWEAITREGITTTNYQLFPGDRVYVQSDHMIATDNFVSKALAPIERLLGAIGLGAGTSKAIKFWGVYRGGSTGGGGGGP